MFGIFNKLNNYQLLRYSNAMQLPRNYQKSNYPNPGSTQIEEVCFENISYDFSNIGRFYNLDTKEFYD